VICLVGNWKSILPHNNFSLVTHQKKVAKWLTAVNNCGRSYWARWAMARPLFGLYVLLVSLARHFWYPRQSVKDTHTYMRGCIPPLAYSSFCLWKILYCQSLAYFRSYFYSECIKTDGNEELIAKFRGPVCDMEWIHHCLPGVCCLSFLRIIVYTAVQPL